MTREDAIKGLWDVADWHYGKYEQTHEEDYLNDGDFLTAVANLLKAQEPQWTPITFRALTEEEKEEHPDWGFIIDSPTPDDGEEILVSNGRYVWSDVWGNNGVECYLESGHELEGVAWMNMPTPWKKEN